MTKGYNYIAMAKISFVSIFLRHKNNTVGIYKYKKNRAIQTKDNFWNFEIHWLFN